MFILWCCARTIVCPPYLCHFIWSSKEHVMLVYRHSLCHLLRINCCCGRPEKIIINNFQTDTFLQLTQNCWARECVSSQDNRQFSLLESSLRMPAKRRYFFAAFVISSFSSSSSSSTSMTWQYSNRPIYNVCAHTATSQRTNCAIFHSVALGRWWQYDKHAQ